MRKASLISGLVIFNENVIVRLLFGMSEPEVFARGAGQSATYNVQNTGGRRDPTLWKNASLDIDSYPIDMHQPLNQTLINMHWAQRPN